MVVPVFGSDLLYVQRFLALMPLYCRSVFRVVEGGNEMTLY
jgi:hypothetical protein